MALPLPQDSYELVGGEVAVAIQVEDVVHDVHLQSDCSCFIVLQFATTLPSSQHTSVIFAHSLEVADSTLPSQLVNECMLNLRPCLKVKLHHIPWFRT